MIRTDRLVLRALRADDLEPLHAILSDPRAMRYWDRPAFESLEDSRRLLEAFMRDVPRQHLEYAVDLDGAFIGRVGMWKRYEVGFILSPTHWGRGYATEAGAALIQQVFSQFPEAEELTGEVDPRNIGSCRVLEKLGFVLRRLGEKDFLYGDTEWCDTAYYALPRADAGFFAEKS